MVNFAAADVKRLREATGAGMMDCKNALVEAEGDFERAVEVLRVRGLRGVTKREGRTASNGLVTAKLEDKAGAVLLEVNCETDFVAKNDSFQQLADDVADTIFRTAAPDVTALLAEHVAEGKTVKDLVDEASAKIGEKLEVRRFARLGGRPEPDQPAANKVVAYLHRTTPDLPPQIGVLVEYEGDDEEVARGIAQHVAAFTPAYLTREDVPDETVENERRIAEATAREEGKPEQALPKIVDGRVNGFFKENVLMEQAYARDAKKTVRQVMQEADIRVTRYVRYRVGAN